LGGRAAAPGPRPPAILLRPAQAHLSLIGNKEG
jgi:hypothetical protein